MTIMAMYPQDAGFVAIEEIHAAAIENLPPGVADFLETGAGTQATVRANQDAFGRWVIRPRPMSGVSAPRRSTTFLGMPLSLPVLTAPFGGDGLFGAGGHQAVARANAACGTVSIVPEDGTFSLEEVRAAAPAAARIAQVHPFGSFGPVVRRIRDAGYDALCVTVELVSEQTPAWDWARLAEATAGAGLPWIAKGILTPGAARAALDVGAAAIYVSNHGGRQVDPAPASLDALPEVVRTIELLTGELRALMAFAGTKDIASITPAALAPAPPAPSR